MVVASSCKATDGSNTSHFSDSDMHMPLLANVKSCEGAAEEQLPSISAGIEGHCTAADGSLTKGPVAPQIVNLLGL
jgi:hypothetical protein